MDSLDHPARAFSFCQFSRSKNLSRWRLVLERETGFEPATSTLARWHSTTELLPRGRAAF